MYDVLEEDGQCSVVQEYVNGVDLHKWLALQATRLDADRVANLMADIAEAVGYAHQQGLVHRDLKPENVLMDAEGRPRVADFGLALDERVRRKAVGERAGSPAYMSPEQVRGESNRLDGRSDIWALGVMLYEMLSGRQPFTSDTRTELFAEIQHDEPKPPRQVDPKLPAELERICLKCLSKRMTDRYTTAADLALELRTWRDAVVSRWPAAVRAAEPAAGASPPANSVPESVAARIVPKGLRSFDEQDADFFLDLLPGPRGRDGLPDNIRFWKSRLESTDPDVAFGVGLLYGPSGCGKSSLVKAGLLPRLAPHMLCVYIEATTDDTEARLLRSVRKQLPELPVDASLPDLLADLREGRGLQPGQKVVLVLDQFEQWLNAHLGESTSTLATALRQCDGVHVQALLMVRDDFWMPASRLMQLIEAPILEGQNAGMVDLFDPLHAQKVLAEFGRSYGRLPENLGDLSREQNAFLDEAVRGLSQQNKVYCVQLSLFGDLMKGRPWTVAELAAVGGTTGIGVTFLEETFSAATAPPAHRRHEKALRGVLKALLPTTGSEIKGHMRSADELQTAAEYGNRPRDFAELIRILDRELRLITPTRPVGADDNESSTNSSVPATNDQPPTKRYYQLTHDYLVPSLRDWLTHKQRETRKGRAELKLEERASAWNSLRESKQLPTVWEWLNISLLTDRRAWSAPQRAMMAKASRLHSLQSGFVLAALMAVLAMGAVVRTQVARQQEATRIEGLVGSLVSAEPSQLPGIIEELDAHREVAAKYLSPLVAANATTAEQKRTQLHARLATVSRDPSLAEPLIEELLTGKVSYVIPIRQQLRPQAVQLTQNLRRLLRDPKADTQRRFRAALALAEYVPESQRASWTAQDLQFVVAQLVSANAEFQPLLRDALRPIRTRLLAPIESIFADPSATDSQRLSAANALADYAASDITKLSMLLVDATPEQFAVLYPIVAVSPARSTVDDLSNIAATQPPAELGSAERVPFGQRRANAAATLLRLGEREKMLPVFEVTDDPEALTQFMFRCRPRDVGVDALLDCLRIVSDGPMDRYPSDARYALLLGLGEYTLSEIPESRRESLLSQLAGWYRTDPSSGVHGAAGWLLRQWGQLEVVRQVDQTALPYSADRGWFTLAITVTPQSANAPQEKPAQPLPPKTFYYTFVVFPPGDYEIGSLPDEADRQKIEVRHQVRLTRPFALLDREITFEELIAFSPRYDRYIQQFDGKPKEGGVAANWYDSVGFCRWLSEQSGLSEADQSYAAPESLDKEQYPREPNLSANWAPRNWPLQLGRRGFRLPTESEWEVASRAGARTAFGFGSEASLLERFGWFIENSDKHLHPPRELRPSMRGLFDLHGNIFEWTHDWYGDFAENAAVDSLGAKEGANRVSRGGSWAVDEVSCRTAYRGTVDPTYRTNDRGLRLALSPSAQSPEAGQVGGAEPAGAGTDGASAEQRPEMP